MEERREAIWTVPADWRNTYFILFNVQFVVCLGLVIWHEVSTRGVSDNFVDVLLAVCHSMAPVVITIAAENIVIVEVFGCFQKNISPAALGRGKLRQTGNGNNGQSSLSKKASCQPI